MKADGCKGAMIMSSLPGHYPDDDDAFPFFELAAPLDVREQPGQCHPVSAPGALEQRRGIGGGVPAHWRVTLAPRLRRSPARSW